MGKDPAFLFYSQDFLGGTDHMTFEEKGAYIHLICQQHQIGNLTSTKIKRFLGESYTKIWPEIQEKFKTDGTYFWNERLEIERGKRKEFSKNQSKKGLIGNFYKQAKKDLSYKDYEKLQAFVKGKYNFNQLINLLNEHENIQSAIDAVAYAMRTHIENENEIENEIVIIEDNKSKDSSTNKASSTIPLGKEKFSTNQLIEKIQVNEQFCMVKKKNIPLSDFDFDRMLNDWAGQNNQIPFDDTRHVFNSFGKYLEINKPKENSFSERLNRIQNDVDNADYDKLISDQ